MFNFSSSKLYVLLPQTIAIIIVWVRIDQVILVSCNYRPNFDIHEGAVESNLCRGMNFFDIVKLVFQEHVVVIPFERVKVKSAVTFFTQNFILTRVERYHPGSKIKRVSL